MDGALFFKYGADLWGQGLWGPTVRDLWGWQRRPGAEGRASSGDVSRVLPALYLLYPTPSFTVARGGCKGKLPERGPMCPEWVTVIHRAPLLPPPWLRRPQDGSSGRSKRIHKQEKPNRLRISSLISAGTTISNPRPKAVFSNPPKWSWHPIQPGCVVHCSVCSHKEPLVVSRGHCNMQRCSVSFPTTLDFWATLHLEKHPEARLVDQ